MCMCKYVRMYVFTKHIRTYVHMYVCTYLHTYIRMYVCRWILVSHSSSYCYFLCMILGGTVASHTVQYARMYLKDLLHKGVCWLQVHLLTVLLDGWNEHRVVWFRQLHTREQVRRDALHTDGQTLRNPQKATEEEIECRHLHSEMCCTYF